MAKREDREQFVKNHPHVVARETPNSYEAETALIGGVLIDGQTATKFMPQLGADDFYTPAHKFIIEAIRDLFNAAKPIDLVTVVGQLENKGTLELAGGVEYLSKLIAAVPSVANAEYYFDTVKKHTRLRAIINIAKRMADEAYALDPDDNALSRAEAALYGLAESNRRGKPEQLGGFYAHKRVSRCADGLCQARYGAGRRISKERPYNTRGASRSGQDELCHELRGKRRAPSPSRYG